MLLHSLIDALIHLAFPQVCEGCGTDTLNGADFLCLRCLSELPQTDYQFYPGNPVEKLFWGRLPLTHATAQYYFTKQSVMQQLLHQLKYKGNRELGIYLGTLMGAALQASNRFRDIDGLVPLPLHPQKQRKRGYNQAALLCRGMSTLLQVPVLDEIVIRREATETQTKKTRVERWQNMEGKFRLSGFSQAEGKHLLLVDDVITTGATLESCGSVLLQSCSQLSIATLCFSAH